MTLLRNRRFLAPLAVASLTVLLWPTSYLASPQWDVVVVDGEGQPRKGANVRLVYENYSVEDSSHEVTLQTDERGRVSFAPNHQRATLLQRAFYTASAATGGVHASFGRHAHVFAFGDGYEGTAVGGDYVADWQGYPDSMQSKSRKMIGAAIKH